MFTQILTVPSLMATLWRVYLAAPMYLPAAGPPAAPSPIDTKHRELARTSPQLRFSVHWPRLSPQSCRYETPLPNSSCGPTPSAAPNSWRTSSLLTPWVSSAVAAALDEAPGSAAYSAAVSALALPLPSRDGRPDVDCDIVSSFSLLRYRAASNVSGDPENHLS
jgi:hypothetical protein